MSAGGALATAEETSRASRRRTTSDVLSGTLAVVHPIERLRYVARASGVDQSLLVQETASALGAFRSDPAGMVTACRRIVSRHPTSGALWWLCGRVLTADDPMGEAWRAADEIDADATVIELAHALPDDATVCLLGWPEQVGDAIPRRGDLEALVVDVLGEGSGLVRRLVAAEVDAVDVATQGLGAAAAAADLVLLEASAVGPSGFMAVAGSRAAAAVARHEGTPVWLVAGVGRLLPRRVWEAAAGRVEVAEEPWEADDELVPLDLVDRIVGPSGPERPADALRRTDCPVAAELLVRL